jgi:hypothetical protein
MEKLQVFQVLECNKTLYKMLEQRTAFPISVGLKIHRIMKSFDEVEEYVFETMDMTFGNFDWKNMTNEQIKFYNDLISQEIEVECEKIPISLFEKNEKLMLTIEDINSLSIILC